MGSGIVSTGGAELAAGMEPEHHKDKEAQLLKELLPAIEHETRRILDRMVELRWASRWAADDRRRIGGVALTDEGRRRLREFRNVVDGVEVKGLVTWVALDSICHDRPPLFLG